jgi:outer membrane immunogenic protein
VTNGARAAEIPVWAPPVYQAPIAIVPTWTGIYLGLNAGWGWTGSNDSKFRFAGPFGILDVKPFNQVISSPVFGGQLGYNYQTGSWVWGVEGDVDGSNMRINRSATVPGLGTAFLNERQNWIASARARIGYVWGPGMSYVIAGVAWSNTDADGGATLFAGGVSTFNVSQTRRGSVMGAGYEWMIAPNWSVRGEFLYYTFAGTVTGTNTFPAVGTNVAEGTAKFNTGIARVGIDYKFDWGSPTATRY